MGLSMTASRVAAPLPKNSIDSTNVNSTTSKPSKAYGFASNTNSIKFPAPPVMDCSSSNAVSIPAISLKLRGSSSNNGKTPLELLLENPIQFVKASLMSPVYKTTPKEAFGTPKKFSPKKPRRVMDLPIQPSSSPRKNNPDVQEGVEAKSNKASCKVPSPAHRKVSHKSVKLSIAMNKTDIVTEKHYPEVTNDKPTVVAVTTKAVPFPTFQCHTNGDIDMSNVGPSAIVSAGIDKFDIGSTVLASTDHRGIRSTGTLPATVTQPSYAKVLMGSCVQAVSNGTTAKNLTNGDSAAIKKPVNVLTNGVAEKLTKVISKKRKAEDPEASSVAQKYRKVANGVSKKAEFPKLNGVKGESSNVGVKQPGVSLLQPGIRTKGLLNRRNDCYRNSVLQLICSSSVFYEEIVKHDFDNCKIGYCVCCGLGLLIQNHHFKSALNNRSKTNDAIKDVMRLTKVLPKQFRGARQEDAAEYLHAILHSCKDQLTKGLKGDALKNNPIDQTFDGSFPSVLTCPKCNHRSFNKTDLPSLMLLPSIRAGQNRAQNTICLEEVLDNHFRPEKVDATCEKCKFAGKKFTKQVEVEKLPKFLVLNMVRWTQACLRGGVVRADKIMNRLKYDEKMMMIEGGKKVEYLLNAVVAHCGRSLSGGHYISFVRQPDGSWASCNDQYVTQTTWTIVAKADGMQASILGYQRVN